jgi:hypothetical protein
MKRCPGIVLLAASLFAVALSATGCATQKAPPVRATFKATAPEGMLLVEAEAFRLVDAKIIDDPDASDGRAVVLRTPRAYCSFELDLAPGAYVAAACVRAADDQHDEFFLSTLDSLAGLNPGGRFGRYVLCSKIIEFTITKSVKDYIQFASFSSLQPKGESGVIVDYIVICEKSRWEAAPIDLE